MAVFTNTWDAAFSAAPASSQVRAQGATRIMETRLGIYQRFSQEHYHAGDTRDGMHVAGSAMAYYQATAPTNLPGTALGPIALGNDVYSKGRLWLDSSADHYGVLYYYTGTTFAPVLIDSMMYSHDSAKTQDNWFDAFSTLLPSTNQYASMTGAFTLSSGSDYALCIPVYIRRYSSTQMELTYLATNITNGDLPALSGATMSRALLANGSTTAFSARCAVAATRIPMIGTSLS